MRVSVIIPVYNVEKYIADCLESVLKQSFSDFEIICVNDRGTDASWEIVCEYAKKDSRIVLIENERNMGLAATRNAGLKAAKGEFVYFLDSDDMIREDALSLLCREIGDAQVVAFESEFIYESEDLIPIFSKNPSVFKGDYPDVLSGRELFAKWMEIWDWMPCQPRYFYRRDFLLEEKLSYPVGMIHEDEIFTFDVLTSAKRVKVLKEKLFIRRFRADSIMTGKVTMGSYEGCIRILRHVYRYMLEHKLDSASGIPFYMSKIATNARGKYQSILNDYLAETYNNTESLQTAKNSPCPKISVVIPVYNSAPYLRECLDSVLLQDLWHIEIIAVDDGSTDDSLSILREYERTDARVKVFTNEKNEGQSVARNKGLDAVSGKYVYMLDSDDYIVEGALSELYDAAEKDGLDLVAFENRQFTDEEDLRKQADTTLFSYKGNEGIFVGTDAFSELVTKDLLSPSVPTYFLRWDLIEENHLRFVEHIFHEDIGFILDMLVHAKKTRLISKGYFMRRLRHGSTVTSGFTDKNMRGYIRSFLKVYEIEEQIKRNAEEPDPKFVFALSKWKRDILGRIRTLYLSGNKLYTANDADFSYADCSKNDPDVSLVCDCIKEMTTTKERAEVVLKDVFGELISERLLTDAPVSESLSATLESGKIKEVYICGTGQYANRAIASVGALGYVIKGIIDPEGNRKIRSLRGYAVFLPEEISDRDTSVLVCVSHYRREEYVQTLKGLGFSAILYNTENSGLNAQEDKKIADVNQKEESFVVHAESEILDLMHDDTIKVISFDLFDTLIQRPFSDDTDIFALLDQDFSQYTDSVIDFKTLRLEAESVLRRKIIKEDTRSDITLEEIYEVLVREFGISPKVAQYLKEREIRLEKQILRARPFGRKLYAEAKKTGKRVILTSDMYLGKEILEPILQENGYRDYDAIYVSCDVRKRKIFENLYMHVLTEEKLNPDELLHIGDNWEADAQIPTKMGIRAVWVPSTKYVYGNSATERQIEKLCSDLTDWEKAKTSIGLSAMLRLVANRMYDNPFATTDSSAYFGNPYLVGYGALGMELLALVRWIIKTVRKNKNTNLVFLSRDGYLVKQAYDLLRKERPELPDSSYLHVSRLSLLPAMYERPEDLYALPIDKQYHTDETIFKLLSYCSKDNPEMALSKYRNETDSQPEENKNEAYRKLIKWFVENEYSDEKAKESVEIIGNYLRSGKDGQLTEKSAVFDMGYSGRISYGMTKASGINPDYLFFHTDPREHFRLASRAGLNIEAFFDFNPYMESSMREYAYLEVAPSCVGYTKAGEACYDVGPAKGYGDAALQMQKGALDFIRDYLELFAGYTDRVVCREHEAAMPFEAFLRFADGDDREIYANVLIDDELWGGRRDINLKSLMEARLRKMPAYAKLRDE